MKVVKSRTNGVVTLIPTGTAVHGKQERLDDMREKTYKAVDLDIRPRVYSCVSVLLLLLVKISIENVVVSNKTEGHRMEAW